MTYSKSYSTDCNKLSQPPKFQSHYKKRRKGIDFYAWQEPDRYIGSQLYSSSDFVKIPRTRFSEDRYVNAKQDADFVTISTFKKAWYYKTLESGKKVRELGKKGEFIYSIKGCFADFDATENLLVSEDVITQRGRALELPEPTYILRTSCNNFQAVWIFKDPLILNKKEWLQRWKETNKALNLAFADLGADINIAGDATRYLRNPHKKGAVNLKYPNKPEVSLVRESGTVKFADIYYALADHNYIKQVRKHKPKKLQAGEPEKRITTFIINNPGWTGTYSQLSELTGVSERAIHYLRERQKIQVQRIRVGKTCNIKPFVNSGNKSEEYVNSSDCKPYYNSNISLADDLGKKVTLFNQNGLNFNFRNSGTWMMTLFLKENGYSDQDSIQKALREGLKKSKFRGAHRFNEKEWQKTIRSALKDCYRFYHNSSWARELSTQLNENHLQSQKPPKTLEKFDAITNGYSRPVEGKSEHSHTPSVKSTSGN